MLFVLYRNKITRHMSDKISLPEEIISNKIYYIREQKVMLDRDLAELYGVETKRLKEAVRRNAQRFPSDFMFEMTKEEFLLWRTQFASSKADKKGLRYMPYCFTDQGITMLSCVLNSKKAINVNIQIMRIFTKLRQTLTDNLSIKLEIEEIKKKLSNQDKNIELVFSYLDELMENRGVNDELNEVKQDKPKPRTIIGFKIPPKNV